MRRRLLLRVVVACLGVLAMAPTPGDVGGCGSEAELLDPASFSEARKRIDCELCLECSVATERCTRACDPAQPSDIAVPATCRPLFRDGQVCLRAIAAASCEAFATYVDDDAPRSPTECQFCRESAP